MSKRGECCASRLDSCVRGSVLFYSELHGYFMVFSKPRIFGPALPRTDDSPAHNSSLTDEAHADSDSGDDAGFYIGIHSGSVAIFQGRPGKGGILLETTNIPLDKIPEFEIRNLEAGIPFSTEEEKYSILEGLHFPL